MYSGKSETETALLRADISESEWISAEGHLDFDPRNLKLLTE